MSYERLREHALNKDTDIGVSREWMTRPALPTNPEEISTLCITTHEKDPLSDVHQAIACMSNLESLDIKYYGKFTFEQDKQNIDFLMNFRYYYLKKLRILALQYTGLYAIPIHVYSLHALTDLIIYGSFKEIPSDIASLYNLVNLRLRVPPGSGTFILSMCVFSLPCLNTIWIEQASIGNDDARERLNEWGEPDSNNAWLASNDLQRWTKK